MVSSKYSSGLIAEVGVKEINWIANNLSRETKIETGFASSYISYDYSSVRSTH